MGNDNKSGTTSKDFQTACTTIPLSDKTKVELGAYLESRAAALVGAAGAYTGNPFVAGGGVVGYLGGIGTAAYIEHMKTVDDKQMDALAGTKLTDCAFTDTYRSIHGSSAAVSVLDAARDPQTFAIVSREMTDPQGQKFLKEFEALEKGRLSTISANTAAPQTQPAPTVGIKAKP